VHPSRCFGNITLKPLQFEFAKDGRRTWWLLECTLGEREYVTFTESLTNSVDKLGSCFDWEGESQVPWNSSKFIQKIIALANKPRRNRTDTFFIHNETKQ